MKEKYNIWASIICCYHERYMESGGSLYFWNHLCQNNNVFLDVQAVLKHSSAIAPVKKTWVESILLLQHRSNNSVKPHEPLCKIWWWIHFAARLNEQMGRMHGGPALTLLYWDPAPSQTANTFWHFPHALDDSATSMSKVHGALFDLTYKNGSASQPQQPSFSDKELQQNVNQSVAFIYLSLYTELMNRKDSSTLSSKFYWL